ncbi:MAG: hypothetical protein ACLTR6_05695 [Clostridium fessum]
MKFKKCGPEHEASYLFELKNWMRSGNDFSELLESICKGAYLKGFRRVARKKPVMDSGIRIAVKIQGR